MLGILASESIYFEKTKRFDDAMKVFIERYRIGKRLGDFELIEEVRDDFECFCFRSFKIKEQLQRRSEFNQATKEFSQKNGTRKIASGEVSGQAISLPPPAITDMMRTGLRGSVLVKITISKEGEVLQAKAICGTRAFYHPVEVAALKARFRPTLLDNEPVEVTGYIQYSFN